MEWYKRYTNRANHGQMYEAGFWGGVVFDALCDSSAAYDLEGRLPQVYAEPEYLAHQLRLTNAELCICHEASRNVTTAKNDSVTHENHVVTVLSEALKRLFLAGLLVKEGDLIVIDGWERKQRKVPKSDAERARNYREKKKTQKLIEDENQTNTSVTKRHIHESDANVRVTHREEESREEKIREDKKRINKKQKKADALSPEKPATVAKSEKPSTPGFDFKALTNRLMDTFQEVRGQKYLHGGAKDGVALDRLSKFESDEILRRWRRGLEEKVNPWLQVNTFAQLAQKFNDLGAPPVQSKLLPSVPKPERPKVLTKEERAELLKDRPPIRIEVISAKEREENLDGPPEEDENSAWGQS